MVGIFPDHGAIIRLVGAVLAEHHDERIEGRRYLGPDVLARSPATSVTDTDPTEQEDHHPRSTHRPDTWITGDRLPTPRPWT